MKLYNTYYYQGLTLEYLGEIEYNYVFEEKQTNTTILLSKSSKIFETAKEMMLDKYGKTIEQEIKLLDKKREEWEDLKLNIGKKLDKVIKNITDTFMMNLILGQETTDTQMIQLVSLIGKKLKDGIETIKKEI